jgi:hypothetical protein
MKKILILGVVAVMLSLGLVLAGCDLFNICPDGGGCYSDKIIGWGQGDGYKECSEKCITAQGIHSYSSVYVFDSDKSCTCN